MGIAREDASAAIVRFESHEDGLSASESAARLARNGPNEVAHEKPLPGWLHLWHCYQNPFNLLLTALAVVSYLTRDAKATIVISAMVLLSTVIRFVQEGRSNRAAERLKAMVSNTATVLRRLAGPELRNAPAEAPASARKPAAQLEVPLRELVDPLIAKGVKVTLLGGADVASELDAKRAINQASRVAAAVA